MVVHPILEAPGMDDVQFVTWSALENLPVPWPRCQDLAASDIGAPSRMGLVLAVSHAWPCQAHPDPFGRKMGPIGSMVAEAIRMHPRKGDTTVFLDFLAVPQEAFARGQKPRTEQMAAKFSKALRAFPWAYLMADATLHLDFDMSDDGCDEVVYPDGACLEPCKGDVYEIPANKLNDAKLVQHGHVVQVSEPPEQGMSSDLALFDEVVAVGKQTIQSLDQLQLVLAKASRKAPKGRTAEQTCAQKLTRLAFQTCYSNATIPPAKMVHRPWGRENRVPASRRGWVFLERFASMVKVAMVHESHSKTVALSNNLKVLQQIFDGGKKLREAAERGREALGAVLRDFVEELIALEFSSTSSDKQNVRNSFRRAQSQHIVEDDLWQQTAAPGFKVDSDQHLISRLMARFVRVLQDNWAKQEALEKHRQLILAVAHDDLDGTRKLLLVKADPNTQDSLGQTCLHVAAQFRLHSIAALLIEFGASRLHQDRLGDSPAHLVPMSSDALTVPTFSLLAPTAKELSLKNRAGITPLRRFEVWVLTESCVKQFPPADEHLQWLRANMPEAFSSEPVARSLDNLGKRFGEVASRTEVCRVGGTNFGVHVSEPVGQNSHADIIWLSLSFFVPTALGAKALQHVARRVCHTCKVRIFTIDCGALGCDPSAFNSFGDLHRCLHAIVQALPIRQPCVLVDSSLGEATPLLWALQRDLSGALVINFRDFHADGFLATPLSLKVTERFGFIEQLFRRRDFNGLTALLPDYALSNDPAAFGAALVSEPAEWFKHGVFHCGRIRKDVFERTRAYKSLGTLEVSFPVTLACGSFAPAMWTLQAVMRLQELIPGSKVEHIPEDKSCWELEGEVRALHVAELLVEILGKIDVSGHRAVEILSL